MERGHMCRYTYGRLTGEGRSGEFFHSPQKWNTFTTMALHRSPFVARNPRNGSCDIGNAPAPILRAPRDSEVTSARARESIVSLCAWWGSAGKVSQWKTFFRNEYADAFCIYATKCRLAKLRAWIQEHVKFLAHVTSDLEFLTSRKFSSLSLGKFIQVVL